MTSKLQLPIYTEFHASLHTPAHLLLNFPVDAPHKSKPQPHSMF